MKFLSKVFGVNSCNIQRTNITILTKQINSEAFVIHIGIMTRHLVSLKHPI